MLQVISITTSKRHDGNKMEEAITAQYKKLIVEIGHFPTNEDLDGRGMGGMLDNICKYGGINHFRNLLGWEPPQKPKGYWTEENTIIELKKIINILGHFPSFYELKGTMKGYSGVERAIKKHGGINKFRDLLGHEIHHKSPRYWADESNIIKELKQVLEKSGRFPLNNELADMDRQDLLAAMNRMGGTNKFRELLGYDVENKSPNYWSDDNNIIKELRDVVDELGYYPSCCELGYRNRHDLAGAIITHGGTNKFRRALGYDVSAHAIHISEEVSYRSRRGKNTEKLVEKILCEWCKNNGYPEPTYNNKLTEKNVIEFVCNLGKRIGIDVTNTKSPSGDVVRRKYKRKKYHLYLDELWIVVFSDVYRASDYLKWNRESPANVKVMSIDDFLIELDHSTDEYTRNKIDSYKHCTFSTKDQIIMRQMPQKPSDNKKATMPQNTIEPQRTFDFYQ